MHYRIHIKGHLDPSWQEWLEGLQIVHEPDGTSLLGGPLADQPALLGVLIKLSHLGALLLSLDSDSTADDAERGCSPTRLQTGGEEQHPITEINDLTKP